MLKLTVVLSLMLVASSVRAQSPNAPPENYLVLNGRSHHFSPAPQRMGKWNQANTGLSYQRVYPSEPYRYSTELGFFKDSYGKPSYYLAGSALQDITDFPRISVGGMVGLSYRTNAVSDIYYNMPGVPILKNHTPVLEYAHRELTPMAGLMLQMSIPSTPIVLQTTFVPKVKTNSSAIVFGQMLVRF